MQELRQEAMKLHEDIKAMRETANRLRDDHARDTRSQDQRKTEEEMKKTEDRHPREREGARIKAEMEIKRRKDEARRVADHEKHDVENKRVIEDHERK